jgi:hypothetical protein
VARISARDIFRDCNADYKDEKYNPKEEGAGPPSAATGPTSNWGRCPKVGGMKNFFRGNLMAIMSVFHAKKSMGGKGFSLSSRDGWVWNNLNKFRLVTPPRHQIH